MNQAASYDDEWYRDRLLGPGRTMLGLLVVVRDACEWLLCDAVDGVRRGVESSSCSTASVELCVVCVLWSSTAQPTGCPHSQQPLTGQRSLGAAVEWYVAHSADDSCTLRTALCYLLPQQYGGPLPHRQISR